MPALQQRPRQAAARSAGAAAAGAALRPMGLAHVRLPVALEPGRPVRRGRCGAAFLFSANPGQPLAPLAEVASGGEMSRFLLALKTCLAAADAHVTLLFDEIDAGVQRPGERRHGRSLLQRLAASARCSASPTSHWWPPPPTTTSRWPRR
jgi:DNA repair protein RecN (Recombination protein N)